MSKSGGRGELDTLEVERIRADFPILNRREADRPLVYLDNAATTHMPATVIAAMEECYRGYCGPVHRGLYPLAEEATRRYEDARARLARFLNAPSGDQIVFTRSTTESINLVAQQWARPRLGPGDTLWVTRMEHHSNFLPWQRVCAQTGARLGIIEIDERGILQWESCRDLFAPATRLIALTLVSNVLGTINPVREIAARAAARGIPLLVDAAQAAGHFRLDVRLLGCDFLALSAHKMYGPTGIGALWGKSARLGEMEPLLLGGGMVDQVADDASSWAEPPLRFEAGSPNLAGAVGFAAAADFVESLGSAAIERYLDALTRRAMAALADLRDVVVYGPDRPDQRSGIVSFNLDGVHAHDLAQVAGESGVALRAGHHCCMPLMRRLGVAATARASFAVYNRPEDVEALVGALARARAVFG